MAQNLLRNATFLDGVTGWTRTPTNALTTFGVDEATRGAPGRGVLAAAGTVLADAAVHAIDLDAAARPAVTEGDLIEVSTWWWSNDPGAVLRLRFRDGGGSIIGNNAVPMVRAPGDGQRGLPETFAFSRGRFTAPANTASADLRLMFTSSGTGAARTLALFRPFLGKVAAADPAQPWTPGQHDNPDLNLRVWPIPCGQLKGSWPAAPTQTHQSFATDSGVPLPRRVASTPRWEARPEYWLSRREHDQLLAFHEATEADGDRDFWFVEPQLSRLCRAFWLDDGAPVVTEQIRAGLVAVRVGLLLQVA